MWAMVHRRTIWCTGARAVLVLSYYIGGYPTKEKNDRRPRH